MAVGDGDGGGALDNVDEPIGAVPHGKMVEPDVRRSENRDTISIASGPDSNVVYGVSDHATSQRLSVVDVKAVDDHILDELQGDSATVGDVHVGATRVDGLVAGH